MSQKKINRRDFLKATGAVGLSFMVLPRRILGGKAYASPNEELTRAIVGVGGMGMGHIDYPVHAYWRSAM